MSGKQWLEFIPTKPQSSNNRITITGNCVLKEITVAGGMAKSPQTATVRVGRKKYSVEINEGEITSLSSKCGSCKPNLPIEKGQKIDIDFDFPETDDLINYPRLRLLVEWTK